MVGNINSKYMQDKAQFREDASKIREGYQSELKQIEGNNEKLRDAQAKNFIKQKNDLEQENKEVFKSRSKQTTDAINEKKEDYQERLNTYREKFEVRNKKDRIQFNEKLTKLNENFDRSIQNQDKNYAKFKNSSQQVQNERIDNLKKNFDKNVKDISKEARSNVERSRSQVDQEKKDLIFKNEIAQSENAQEQRSASEGTTERFRKEIENLRGVQKDELVSIKKNYTEGSANHHRNSLEEKAQLRENFNDISTRIEKRAGDNQKKMNQTLKESLNNQERSLSDALVSEKKKNKEFKISMNEDKGAEGKVVDSLKGKQELRIQDINERNSIKDNDVATDKKRMQDDFAQSSKSLKSRNSLNLTKKLHENNQASQNTISNLRDHSDEMSKKYKNIITRSDINNEAARVRTRKEHNSLNRDRLVEFGRVVNELNTKNSENVSEIQNRFAKEKTEFIEKIKKDKYNEKQEFQATVKNNYERELLGLNGKVNTLSDNIENLKKGNEDKVKVIRKKNSEEITVGKRAEQDRLTQMKKENSRSLRNKDLEKRTALEKQRRKFEKTLTDSKYKSEQKMAKIVERYEGQMKQTNFDLRREMKLKLDESRANYLRLAKTSTDEKAVLVDQYNIKLENLRRANYQAKEVEARRERSDFLNQRYANLEAKKS